MLLGLFAILACMTMTMTVASIIIYIDGVEQRLFLFRLVAE